MTIEKTTAIKPIQITSPYDAEYQELCDRFRYHEDASARRTKTFARLSSVMQWLIPILSGFATIFAGFKRLEYAALTSGVTTLLATINSTVEPKRRYNHYVVFVNRFYEAHMNLRLEKTKIETQEIADAEKMKSYLTS